VSKVDYLTWLSRGRTCRLKCEVGETDKLQTCMRDGSVCRRLGGGKERLWICFLLYFCHAAVQQSVCLRACIPLTNYCWLL
jgi:hypothetical protein